MKKTLLALVLTLGVFVTSCSSDNDNDNVFGDSDTELKGKTFIYDNHYTGEMRIRNTYTFENNGNVFNKREIGNSTPYNTKGSTLYYKLNDKKLTIYYGEKGWEKEVQHTEYSQGEYFGDYIIIDGDEFILQKN